MVLERSPGGGGIFPPEGICGSPSGTNFGGRRGKFFDFSVESYIGSDNPIFPAHDQSSHVEPCAG